MKIVCFSVRGMILVLFILSLSFGAQPLLVSQSFAAKDVIGAKGEYDVVTGYVQEVVNDNIKVGDTYYNIASVPLKNKKGREIGKSALNQGAKVEIRLKEGAVKGLTFIHGYSIE